MECPRCHHTQEDAPECVACGVVIAKYEARSQEAETPTPLAEPSPPMPGRGDGWKSLLSGAAVVLVSIGLLFSLLRDAPEESAETGEEVTAGTEQAGTGSHREPTPIEHARRATVQVQSAWARGAGFFVNDGCQIVTSRRVVDPNDRRGEIEERAERAENERRRWLTAKKRHDERVRHGEVDRRKREMKDRDRAHEQLVSAEKRRERYEDEASDLFFDRDAVIVTRADGSTLEVRQSAYSSRRDLALLWVDADDCPFLELVDSTGPPERTPVVAIGPVGSSRRVFRARTRTHEDDRKPYLVFDRWMGGNTLGAPVLGPGGKVIGVITRPEQRMSGDGFAIPADEVLTELGEHFERPLARR